MASTDILLIYPQLGDWDDIMRDVPLSVIYPATEAVKRGYKVKSVDLRLWDKNWRQAIDPILEEGCSLIGISVMTGTPIINSLEVTQHVKSKCPKTPVVWGGPHPTTLPEQTLEHPNVDFVIRDAGSQALAQLFEYLQGGPVKREEILGLGYKEDGQIRLSPPQNFFEMLDYKDIPYHLINISGKHYNRLNTGGLAFPLFMSVGCPYQCTFCVSPFMYKKIPGVKWAAYKPEDVINHIAYLEERYEFTTIQAYDDESFINLDVMKDFLTQFVQRGYHKKYKLDFRGIRFNDIERMDTEYLNLMEKAGVEYMFIGLESGSDRMLKIMKKSIKIDQVMSVNRTLAKHPSLKPHYNFFCGIPGETYESLNETKKVLLQLVKDHPTCYLGHGGHWKPIPGTEVTDVAVKDYDLKLPTTLEGWAAIDTLNFDKNIPDYSWYTPKMLGMIKLLTLAGLLLDGKTKDLLINLHPIIRKTAAFLLWLYRPLLRLRLKFNFSYGLIEMKLYNALLRNIDKVLKNKFKRNTEGSPFQQSPVIQGQFTTQPQAAVSNAYRLQARS